MSEQKYQDDHENDCAYCGRDFTELKKANTKLTKAELKIKRLEKLLTDIIEADRNLGTYKGTKIKRSTDFGKDLDKAIQAASNFMRGRDDGA